MKKEKKLRGGGGFKEAKAGKERAGDPVVVAQCKGCLVGGLMVGLLVQRGGFRRKKGSK
jgi:hypothetical protein